MENLVKGQKVELVKQASESILRFGAGWDVNKGNADDFDIDLAAIVFDGAGKKLGMVYFNQLEQFGIKHSGDNLTGEGDGEDEFFKLDIKKVDSKAEKICIVANVYDAEKRKQNFGQVKNCFVRVTDETSGAVICNADLSEDYSGFTGVILGKVYRHNDVWKFETVLQGSNGDLIKIGEACKNVL